jgi:hypothetical protein
LWFIDLPENMLINAESTAIHEWINRVLIGLKRVSKAVTATALPLAPNVATRYTLGIAIERLNLSKG